MKNSGELSDAVAKLVETKCLLPEVMNAFVFSFDLCGRIKDDIHIVDRDRKLTKHYVWDMKRRNKHNKI